MSDWGFIYVLMNGYMPGVVKIGKTERSPSLRAEELKTTGVPGCFEVVFVLETPLVSEYEAMVHSRMNGIRVDRGEFFKCNTGCAVAVIKEICEDSTFHMYGCLSMLTEEAYSEEELKGSVL